MAASPPLSKSDAHDRPRLSDKNGGRTDAKSPGLCSYYEHDRMKVDIFIDESLKRACLSSSNKSGTSSKEGPGDARHHESNAADLYNVDGIVEHVLKHHAASTSDRQFGSEEASDSGDNRVVNVKSPHHRRSSSNPSDKLSTESERITM